MAIPSSCHGGRGAFRGAVLLAITCIAVPMRAPAQEARVIPLPAARQDGGASIERVLSERRSVREYRGDALSLEDVAQLLWAAQGVTEPRGGLRTAPSAGALYPLETYLVAGSVSGLDAGLYHYLPAEHELVLVRSGDLRATLADVSLRQAAIGAAPVSIVVSAVFARTEGRYGGRAARYVPMEVGSVAQNVALQAVSLGLGSVFIGAFRDEEVSRVLGLPDNHAPLAILPVGVAR